MKLAKFRIFGFQSFSDSLDIEFSEGVNLLIGQNNAGKSALLRAMASPSLPDDRHRTADRWEAYRLKLPEVEITLDVSGKEIHDWILRFGPAHIPMAPNENLRPAVTAMADFFQRTSIPIKITQSANNNITGPYPSHQLFEAPAQGHYFIITAPHNGELSFKAQYGSDDSLPALLINAWRNDMFYFAPERLTIGEAGPGHGARLHPNASNLPNVLHTISNERGDLFRQLVTHLREIFSTVGNLSVRTRPDNHNLEVRVWPTEAMARVELSFPLNSSGTGVSQVIALLTAIMTVDDTVIIIDEINNFLHPAAVKALLRILQSRYAQHQYIISTHAPEVISFSNPKSIHLIKRDGYESSITRLNLSNVEDLREVAEHLGISMADVFAAERVIWVEGPTEELCFPYIYQSLIGPLPRGTIITSVAATGDFNSKRRDPEIVYEVYKRLSVAAAPLVASVAFSFDTEKLTTAEKAKMRQDSGGLLYFLPRRHLECYSVDPAAISAFVINQAPTLAKIATSSAIEAALVAAASQRPFAISEWTNDLANEKWLASVDAAALIKHVCEEISDSQVTFKKKNDTLFLIKHMCENDAQKVSPLIEYVKNLVESTR